MYGEWWNENEDATLKQMLADGCSFDDVAHKLNRTFYSVKGRAVRLGIRRGKRLAPPFWQVATRNQLLVLSVSQLHDYIEECVSATEGLPAEGR